MFRLPEPQTYFNSQPHEEADIRTAEEPTDSLYFNSQPHEEADYRNPQSSHLLEYFNSQPHEEADYERGKNYGRIYISTHSLTKRLTLCH